MQDIRPLNLIHDFNSIKTFDGYINGGREEQIIFDEFKEYAGKMYVAEDEEGYATGLVSISPVFWNSVRMIDHLAVMESRRRRGVASGLITFIIDRAKELNTRILCVQTATWNTGAIGFYEALGFRKRAVLSEYMGDKNNLIWLDIDLLTFHPASS